MRATTTMMTTMWMTMTTTKRTFEAERGVTATMTTLPFEEDPYQTIVMVAKIAT